MKSLIYRNPVISAIIINITSLILFIYSISKGEYGYVAFLMLTGVINRRIIDNGEKLNKQKKTIIITSCVLMVIIFIAYSVYRHNVINEQIINGL
ncbi:hypothetical protein NBE98_10960 [Clostridium swellfunianum]|uniref:hypothetical protein n=1 Tax=Clostridium swellfunianum TaxID=1367462 RepID=UPI00202ED3C7|nr:hypothetical protein [Clostridium swellfunianum]MCM0648893.1 hypothetical protein [Clostridium swellfunianum]